MPCSTPARAQDSHERRPGYQDSTLNMRNALRDARRERDACWVVFPQKTTVTQHFANPARGGLYCRADCRHHVTPLGFAPSAYPTIRIMSQYFSSRTLNMRNALRDGQRERDACWVGEATLKPLLAAPLADLPPTGTGGAAFAKVPT